MYIYCKSKISHANFKDRLSANISCPINNQLKEHGDYELVTFLYNKKNSDLTDIKTTE